MLLSCLLSRTNEAVSITINISGHLSGENFLLLSEVGGGDDEERKVSKQTVQLVSTNYGRFVSLRNKKRRWPQSFDLNCKGSSCGTAS